MESIEFKKYTGAGNDFIMINNYTDKYNIDYEKTARILCPRGTAVGADGLIAVEKCEKSDFRMIYFNSDGSRAEMCGNGGRCVAMFAFREGIAGKRMSFETDAGIHSAEIMKDEVKLEMVPPDGYEQMCIEIEEGEVQGYYINTGVPHFIIFDYPEGNIKERGSEIRYHKRFAPKGTNVDFVRVDNKGKISIRTYERGVEDETLACGTGSVAAALISNVLKKTEGKISIETKSKVVLKVEAEVTEKGFRDVFLQGEAREIYSGRTGRDVV